MYSFVLSCLPYICSNDNSMEDHLHLYTPTHDILTDILWIYMYITQVYNKTSVLISPMTSYNKTSYSLHILSHKKHSVNLMLA